MPSAEALHIVTYKNSAGSAPTAQAAARKPAGSSEAARLRSRLGLLLHIQEGFRAPAAPELSRGALRCPLGTTQLSQPSDYLSCFFHFF